MKADFAAKMGLVENVEQVTNGSQEGSKPLASLDKRYYTPSLRGSEQAVQEELGKITTNLQEDENRAAQEEGRMAKVISAVTPFAGELTNTGKEGYSKLKKGLNRLNQTSGSNVNVVIVNPHESFTFGGTKVYDYGIFGIFQREGRKPSQGLYPKATLIEGSKGTTICIQRLCGIIKSARTKPLRFLYNPITNATNFFVIKRFGLCDCGGELSPLYEL